MGVSFAGTSATLGGGRTLPHWPQPGPSRLGTERLGRHYAGMRRTAPRVTDRLFFAVLPDTETATRIAESAAVWRVRHGLTGRLLKAGHFHVNLTPVHESNGLPDASEIEDWVARAREIPMPSFRVAFDRLTSFANGALVLTGEEGTIGLEVLQQRLSDSLDDTPRPARRYTPHVTLLHDGRHVEAVSVEPVAWTVREVALVHARAGQASHCCLARLPLG